MYSATNKASQMCLTPCGPPGAVLCGLSKCCVIVLQAIWAKGYTELLNLVEKDGAIGDMHTAIDCYGYGDDLHEVGLRWLLGGVL